MIADSDLSRDCCHGLNKSAVRISEPDYTIMPTYSVVQQYVGLKLSSGPHSTTRVSTAQYSRVHERVCLEQVVPDYDWHACKCTTPEVCLLGSGAVSNLPVKKSCMDE